MTVTLLVIAGVVALGDWAAVERRLVHLEYLLKPLTLMLLIAAAASADLPTVKPWIVAGLVFGLLGDVGLMLSDKRAATPDLPFMLGLGSFLIGHVCYLAAFARYGVHGLNVLAGLLIVGGAAVLALPKVLAGARRAGGQELMAVVAAYATMLAAMATLAVGTAAVATAIGGLLFLGSDMLIAFERFVRPVPRGPLLVVSSYHLAQVLILVGLIHSF
ncbi:lysoplasmalogenase [Jatrophihabitans sp.]|uniref:lysoplasmalogenase n=1 Tax=Jatrophihabitans sp. TaxID=1932789 RepID=UPI0030C76D32|nr:hypothetical protein [Jatrophihabitans sp.]